MTLHVGFIVVSCRAIDDLTHLDVLLAEDTVDTRFRCEGWSGDVIGQARRQGFITLGVEFLALVGLRVIVVPCGGIVHLVGEQVAIVVADVVRQAEEVVEVAVIVRDASLLVGHGRTGRTGAPQCRVLCGQHHVALLIVLATHGAVVNDEVSLLDEPRLVGLAHQVVGPITHGVVQPVGGVVDDELFIGIGRLVAQFVAVLVVVGVVVGLHVAQRHAAVGGSTDGERQFHLLGVGIGRTGVGRDILVVDVDAASYVPVVCW